MKDALAVTDEAVLEGEQPEVMEGVEAESGSGELPDEAGLKAEVSDGADTTAATETAEVVKAVVAPTAEAPVKEKRREREARAPKRKPNPRYLMMEMPREKKTNSRAGIKRSVKLAGKISQEMFFRTYPKVSDANYFLERIYPGMVLTRKGSDTAVVKEGFEGITEFWKRLYSDYEEKLASMVLSVKERLESEGVDPAGVEPDFSEPLDEEALVTSRMDQRYIGLLEAADEAEGFISIAGFYDVYTADEVRRLQSEVRYGCLMVYRNTVR
ncbi:MAG: hypothetical protein AB7F61_19400, partial [Desulfobulbus sp.]